MVPFGWSPRFASQMRFVSKPTRSNRSKTYGVLSVGKKVGVVSTWKWRCGVEENPELPIKPIRSPRWTRCPTSTAIESGFR